MPRTVLIALPLAFVYICYVCLTTDNIKIIESTGVFETTSESSGAAPETFGNFTHTHEIYNRKWVPITIDSRNCCFLYSAYQETRTAVSGK